jgi:hypothetical protein
MGAKSTFCLFISNPVMLSGALSKGYHLSGNFCLNNNAAGSTASDPSKFIADTSEGSLQTNLNVKNREDRFGYYVNLERLFSADTSR